MKLKKLMGQARHILSAVGVYLVSTGKIDEAGMQEAIGALMAIAGLLLSWFAPEKKES